MSSNCYARLTHNVNTNRSTTGTTRHGSTWRDAHNVASLSPFLPPSPRWLTGLYCEPDQPDCVLTPLMSAGCKSVCTQMHEQVSVSLESGGPRHGPTYLHPFFPQATSSGAFAAVPRIVCPSLFIRAGLLEAPTCCFPSRFRDYCCGKKGHLPSSYSRGAAAPPSPSGSPTGRPEKKV